MSHSPRRALEQIAYVAGELIAVRDAGFTAEALKYPRTLAGLKAICAFNGVDPDKAPRGWHYYPNRGTKIMWERVIAALQEE